MFNFSDTVLFAVRDRIITCAIAFSQFWLALLILSLAIYGGPLFLLFGLWGLINSFTLLSASTAARKCALTWHIIFLAFVAYGSAKAGNPSFNDPTSRMLELWALVAVATIYYLAGVVGCWGNREN